MSFRNEYPNLCKCLHVGNVTLRNRMCSAPMGFPDLTEDGCLTDGAIAFYENRARGGAAVVTISEACVDYAHGKSHGRLINLQNSACLANLTNAARAIQRHGALASIQMNHSGMLAEFDVVESEKTGDGMCHFGPVDGVSPNGDPIKGMTKADIAYTLEQYRNGARMIKKAGFDMIMIHAGHGWLIHQFLSKVTNRRTDEYGGTIENRARLLLEIIDAVREVVGPGFPLEVRFSAMETDDGGITLEDAIAVAKLMEPKIEILHVSAGGERDFTITHPPMFSEPGCNVHFAAEIKKHVNIPVATVGALNEPAQMEQIIESGQADIVCMARALLADPELPKKVEQNRTDEILRCIRCFVCHAERMLTQTRICALNPEIGREYEAKFEKPITERKRVLIAGGGPGGMQCAVTAAKRGHQVTLCEAKDVLGGSLVCESNVRFKSAFPKYVSTMKRRMELAGVEIRMNTKVTPEFVREFEPDALVVAVGAESLVPPIPGINSKNVVFATELIERENDIRKDVVVLGGGLVGCETGVYLAEKGHEVTIVEMRDAVASDANPRHRPALMKQLDEKTVVHTGYRAKEITDEGLVCVNSEGAEVLIEADAILVAAGMKARTQMVDSLRNTAPIVEVLGDCVKPSFIRNATFRAYHAALDL